MCPQITTLGNGMRVATEANPHAETATVGIWINSGSRFETDANNGTAHFLEHILFKGTKVRAAPGLAAAAAGRVAGGSRRQPGWRRGAGRHLEQWQTLWSLTAPAAG